VDILITDAETGKPILNEKTGRYELNHKRVTTQLVRNKDINPTYILVNGCDFGNDIPLECPTIEICIDGHAFVFDSIDQLMERINLEGIENFYI
jgi:hypothetical protein